MTVTLIVCEIDSDIENAEAYKSIEIGSYEYLNCYLSTISTLLENGKWGSRFPILLESLDAKTPIDPETCEELLFELEAIREELKEFPPSKIDCGNIDTEESDWMLAAPFDSSAENIYNYFLTLDESNLTDTFFELATTACDENMSIMYVFD